jgi:hypothetical protein
MNIETAKQKRAYGKARFVVLTLDGYTAELKVVVPPRR